MTILKFYQKKALAQVFSWEFCEIFKSTFCTAIFLQCFRKMGTLVFNELNYLFNVDSTVL